MHFRLKDNFIVIGGNPRDGPTFVAPHAAIAFHKPSDNQDEGTHYIAYRLVQDGGKAIVSSLTRERDIGIDFYREEPPKELALENFSLFRRRKQSDTKAYRRKYAWVARNVQQHRRKRRIFRSFWAEVAKTRGPILFLHRQFLNPIRHPSLIDVVPFNRKEKVKHAVELMNRRYSKFFNELLPLYKDAFRFKTRGIMFKKKFAVRSGMKVFEGMEPKIERRVSRFREKTDAMPYLKITCMKNFKGKSIRSVVEKDLLPLNVPVLQLEMSEFLTKNHPEIAIYLIKNLIKKI